MNKIPNIAFQSQGKALGIEFLNLKELFTRMREAPNHDPKKPHRIKFNALLLVTKGEGMHQIDLQDYSIQAGDVLKIAKGQVHAFQGDLNYEGVLIVFTEDYVLQYFSQSSLAIISHFYNYHIAAPIVKDCTFNTTFIQAISEEMNRDLSETQQNIIAKLLELHLLKLERLSQDTVIHKTNMKYYSVFVQFQHLVYEKYKETRNVKDYADIMRISTKHLNTIVQQITLNTAKTFIDQFVMLEIKRMIRTTERSLKEIAFELGFDEVTNFSKFFKKHSGVSPKIYKSQD